MNAEPFDEDIIGLLRDRVMSVESLEMLLLLHRTRGRSWTVAEVAARLGLHEEALLPELELLERRGLVTSKRTVADTVWLYAPRSFELDALVGRLAGVYDARTLEVVRFLSAYAVERIRVAAVRTFAGPERRRGRG